MATGTRGGGRWESAGAVRLTAPRLGAARAHVAAPRPRSSEARAGLYRRPQLVKTPRCQRAARSQPLKGRQALYCLYYKAEPDGLLELPPPAAALIHSGQTPALLAAGRLGAGEQARFRRRRAVWEPPGMREPTARPRGGALMGTHGSPRGCPRPWRARGPGGAEDSGGPHRVA